MPELSEIGKAVISTHTLRKEGDWSSRNIVREPSIISTHTLRKEGDLDDLLISQQRYIFQPTPSARRVTI